MNLKDLTPNISVKQIETLYKNQFNEQILVKNLTLKESRKVLFRTQKLIKEFKQTKEVQNSETNPSYLKLRMIEEATSHRIADLVESYVDKENSGSRTMTNNYVKALQLVAQGKKLNESQIKSLDVSRGLRRILESRKLAVNFMRKIIETKKANSVPLMEGEIDSAQTILAAQDIADQIQSMIEKFADIQYKELPALHDSIRNSQGVAEAETFNSALLDSLGQLTQSLETAKADVNNAVAGLTGQEISTGEDDFNMDDLGDEDMDGMDGMDDDLGDEFNMEFEPEEEVNSEEEILGRERR